MYNRQVVVFTGGYVLDKFLAGCSDFLEAYCQVDETHVANTQ